MMLGFTGSITTAPMDDVHCWSVRGVHVVAPVVVRHTPPCEPSSTVRLSVG